jgi:acylphosphatase
MMQKKSVRYIISGLVQGVGYRFFTQNNLRILRLEGSAKNLPDGTVEVITDFDEEKNEILLNALRQGPSRSLVKDIKIEYIDS